MITGRQIREARKLLGWSPGELAGKTKLSTATLVRAESVNDEPSITIATAAIIQGVFEAAGVAFIVESDGSAGVKLQKDNA